MKISTWNVNSVNARIEHLEKFIKKDQSDIYLLQELKTIEAKINDIMLNLDLEGRMDIAKSVMEDIFKSETNDNVNTNSTKYKSLNYQINNQRLMLEKLLNHSEKYN